MSHHEHEHEHHHRHEHEHKHTETLTQHECDGEGHQHHHHEDGTCCCEQHAKEFHGIDKPMLVRLIASAVLYLSGMFLPVGEIGEMILMILSAIIVGYDILWKAAKNCLKGRVFDEYFLISVAAVAAFLIGEAEEGAAVFLLYRVGAFCQSYAIRHSRKTISSLMGDHDGDFTDENNRNSYITKFARIYTPVILALSVLIAVLLPQLGDFTYRDSIYRALTFLVLACPCAIVISVPLAYFAGIAAGMRRGIYFHTSLAVDAAAVKRTAPQIIANELNGSTVYSCHLRDQSSYDLIMKQKDSFDIAHIIAKKTRRVAHENVWFTIGIKLAVLLLSVFGISSLWFAVFADSGITVVAVLNALRAFRPGKNV